MFQTLLGSLFAVTFLVAADLSNSDKETFLKNAKVLQTKTLSQGITNTKRAVLDDGKLRHDAHIQTIDISKVEFEGSRGGKELNFRDCYKFNVAAYELDKVLEINMTPASVERKIAGSAAAVTWWVDDVQMMESERKKKKIEPPDLEDWARQMHVVRVFDQLIFNTDRNLGNLLITKDWKLRMIDHSRAFRIQRTLKREGKSGPLRRETAGAPAAIEQGTARHSP